MPRFGAPPLDKASDRTRRWLQAAAILLAVGIIWLAVAALDRHVPQPGHKDLHPAPTPVAARDHAPVQIAMLQDGNALIQDIPSADPHIHIRWIYPAVSAESTAGRSDTTLQP